MYEKTLREFRFHTAQLRHAYTHLIAERVSRQPEFANGLISPAIKFFETFITGIEQMTAVRHVKRGSTYRVMGYATIQSDRPLSDMDNVVLYMAEDGRIWARPPIEMNDGRFEPIDGDGP